MIRRLGLLIVVLSFAGLPVAQDSPRTERAAHRYGEPPTNPVLDASNSHEADRALVSAEEQRKRRAAQQDMARGQLRKLHEETAQLVTLANELKAELDKTASNKLSVEAVKKTKQIEKLAKNIRGRMQTL